MVFYQISVGLMLELRGYVRFGDLGFRACCLGP